jgi:pimeloyl-ACP methyl ester carboxylesterase
VPYPGAPEGDVDLFLKKDVFVSKFANGVQPATVALLYAAQRPWAFGAGGMPSGKPAWKTIPSWWALGTSDNIITPASQRSMAERAKSKITEVDAGHLSMVSHPEVILEVIRRAASEVL